MFYNIITRNGTLVLKSYLIKTSLCIMRISFRDFRSAGAQHLLLVLLYLLLRGQYHGISLQLSQLFFIRCQPRFREHFPCVGGVRDYGETCDIFR